MFFFYIYKFTILGSVIWLFAFTSESFVISVYTNILKQNTWNKAKRKYAEIFCTTLQHVWYLIHSDKTCWNSLKSSKYQPINDSTIYNAFSRVTAREGAATFFLPTEFVSHSTNICE